VIAIVALASFTACGFAKQTGKYGAETFKGVITSIDTAKSELVIKNEAGTEKTIGVDATMISTLKVGEMVKATLNAEGTKATKVKQVVAKVAKAKK